jgi:hypothetical protein
MFIDQSSLAGLQVYLLHFPGDKSPGYYHLVPTGRTDKNVKLTLIGERPRLRFVILSANLILPGSLSNAILAFQL